MALTLQQAKMVFQYFPDTDMLYIKLAEGASTGALSQLRARKKMKQQLQSEPQ